MTGGSRIGGVATVLVAVTLGLSGWNVPWQDWRAGSAS